MNFGYNSQKQPLLANAAAFVSQLPSQMNRSVLNSASAALLSGPPINCTYCQNQAAFKCCQCGSVICVVHYSEVNNTKQVWNQNMRRFETVSGGMQQFCSTGACFENTKAAAAEAKNRSLCRCCIIS